MRVWSRTPITGIYEFRVFCDDEYVVHVYRIDRRDNAFESSRPRPIVQSPLDVHLSTAILFFFPTVGCPNTSRVYTHLKSYKRARRKCSTTRNGSRSTRKSRRRKFYRILKTKWFHSHTVSRFVNYAKCTNNNVCVVCNFMGILYYLRFDRRMEKLYGCPVGIPLWH